MTTGRIVINVSQKGQKLTPHKQIRVCAYARVSTNHEAQIMSLENQIDYYKRKFSKSDCYNFLGVFSDSGISGAKVNRPGFEAMLKKARSGEIDFIYTKSVSRFARNALMLLDIVRELKSNGVGVIFDDQNINTIDSEGELMLTVLAGVAEEERKSVQSNIQWDLKKKLLRGEVTVDANRLLGYGKDNYGKLIILPEQAEIVERIFRMYNDGLSAYKIAQVFNKEKIPSYSNKPWKSSRILSIISNEKYAGNCLLQKSFINENGHQVRNRGQRDQYWVEFSHPAIIPQTEWDKAQQIRKTRSPSIYPYTSLLRCTHCGSSLIRVVHSKQWVSWICGRYQHLGKSTCTGSRISEKLLIELTKEHPITRPVILKEINNYDTSTKKRQKDYRFIPLTNSTKR